MYPQTRPEMLHKLINRSFILYKTVFPHVLLLSFCLSFIVFLPRIVSAFVGFDIFFTAPFFSPIRLWLLLVDFVAFIFFAAILWRVRSFVYQEHESYRQDLHIGIKKLPFIFLASLLQFIIITSVGLVAVIFYGILYQANLLFSATTLGATLTTTVIILQFVFCIYLIILFYFYMPLIVLENSGIIKSLTRSASLVYGHWWKTFWLQITPWVVYLLFMIAFKNVFHLNLHIYFSIPTKVDLTSTLVHILLFAVFIPWVASVLFVQLRDLEIRKKIHEEKFRTDPVRI